MPEFVLHQITPDGQLGNLVEQVVKEGVVREVEGERNHGRIGHGFICECPAGYAPTG